MGIYRFFIGKGIIVPVAYFEHKFRREIEVETKAMKRPYPSSAARRGVAFDRKLDTVEDIFTEVLSRLTGRIDLDVVLLGHDAFHGRGGLFDVPALEETPQHHAIIVINRTYARYGNSTSSRGPFMFIGKCQDVKRSGPRMSYRVCASELLYSLPAYLDDLSRLTTHYNKLEVDLSKVSQHQQPCVWTFASDCCECCI